MIESRNILKSTKVYGRYEKPLINRLRVFFSKQGYTVVPHARFNISWGSIISDLDLILIKKNVLTLVEVKSCRDSVKKAEKQVLAVQNYVDFAYIAVEQIPRNWGKDRRIGVIIMTASNIDIIHEASPLRTLPNLESMTSLQKKCLSRMAGFQDERKTKNYDKTKIASFLLNTRNSVTLKDEVKEVLTCGLKCEQDCPIWQFSHIPQKNRITCCISQEKSVFWK